MMIMVRSKSFPSTTAAFPTVAAFLFSLLLLLLLLAHQPSVVTGFGARWPCSSPSLCVTPCSLQHRRGRGLPTAHVAAATTTLGRHRALLATSRPFGASNGTTAMAQLDDSTSASSSSSSLAGAASAEVMDQMDAVDTAYLMEYMKRQRQEYKYKDFWKDNQGSDIELVEAMVAATSSFAPDGVVGKDVDDITNIMNTATITTTTKKDGDGNSNFLGLSEVNLARLLLLGAAALYGTNFSLVKLLGETNMPVGLSSTMRFGMAALATSPWLFPEGESPEELAAVVAGLEVGIWNSIGYVAQAVGLETTDASKSAFICSLAVVVVPFLDRMAGKKIKGRELVGAFFALAGVAMLELGGIVSDGGSLQLSPGDMASLVQPLAFGIGFWRMEKAMHQYPQYASKSTAAQLLAVFFGSAVYCGLVDTSSAFSLNQMQQWLTDPMILMGLFWTGCVSTALTVYMETVALKTLTASETTLIFSTEPIWGTIFAAVVMGEHLGMHAAAGAILILTGCLFANLGLDGFRDFVVKRPNMLTAEVDGNGRACHEGHPVNNSMFNNDKNSDSWL